MSSIACFYYIRLIKIVFFNKDSKNSLWLSCNTRKNAELIICPLVVFNVLFFISPDFLSSFSTVLGLILF
jgi:NADH:ubiquinone oxidoreductase subunit 2 (subunit N)